MLINKYIKMALANTNNWNTGEIVSLQSKSFQKMSDADLWAQLFKYLGITERTSDCYHLDMEILSRIKSHRLPRWLWILKAMEWRSEREKTIIDDFEQDLYRDNDIGKHIALLEEEFKKNKPHITSLVNDSKQKPKRKVKEIITKPELYLVE